MQVRVCAIVLFSWIWLLIPGFEDLSVPQSHVVSTRQHMGVSCHGWEQVPAAIPSKSKRQTKYLAESLCLSFPFTCFIHELPGFPFSSFQSEFCLLFLLRI